MKNMKKVFALVLALVVVFALTIPVMAEELPTGTAGDDKTITITSPAGLGASDSVTYTVYRVFAATTNGTAISYQLLNGVETAPSGFVVDDARNVYLGTATAQATNAAGEIEIMVGGVKKYIVPATGRELTSDEIAAIAAYTAKEEVGTVTITGPSTAKTVTVPDYGYFYITTTTGTVVTINSTHKSVSVADKNSVPTIDKDIVQVDATYGSITTDGKNAIAQVGTTVKYEVEIKVGKGAKGYKFHDTLGAGLQYNNDAAVTGINANQYTILTTPESGDTITITFVDGIAADTVIKITYTATVTSDALQTSPAKNDAKIDYGNGSTYTVEVDDANTPSVYNAKFTVTKTDGDDAPLPGAGFVIMNAAGKYYKLANNAVTWVDSINDADEHVSDANGAVAPFTGLGIGTYTLHEKTTPNGYNQAADSTFIIAEKDVTAENLVQAKTVVNNAGAVLPSTGGIGTTIFYIVGAILLIGAGVILVARRRTGKEN